MSMADVEMITPRMSRRWELDSKLTYIRAEAAKVGVLVETKTKFTYTHGILRDVSEIHVIDPKSTRKASFFGSMALHSSAVAGAAEAEFAREWSAEFWVLRSLLLEVHSDMVNEPEWAILNTTLRPKQITLWKDVDSYGRDFYANGVVGYGGWLSDEDVLSPYRKVYYPSDFSSEFNFYTMEF